MSDKPILFSAPMVRALLYDRKTQTRRVIKQPDFPADGCSNAEMGGRNIWWDFWSHERGSHRHRFKLPIGVGDRLYVREAWRVSNALDDVAPRDISDIGVSGGICYEADQKKPTRLIEIDAMTGRLRQAMHMPRWASRLTLIVTDVRVQRLQELSREDALAEGVEMESADPPFYYVPGIYPHSLTAVGVEDGQRHAERSYAKLWDSLNAARGYAWDVNPWVVAYTFTVHKVNIDQMKERKHDGKIEAVG